MSAIAIKVKRFYHLGLYSASQVQAFANKGAITQAECDEILNEEL